ncbi:MAG: stage III sporulation protein AA [Firmicutes bacterium]|nr:stage III sporulation protein AA [Bacillota bacterium]
MPNTAGNIIKQISPLLAPKVRFIVENLPNELLVKTEEIRLRHSRPLIIIWSGGESYLGPKGPVVAPRDAYMVSDEDLVKTLELISSYSLYAYEEELKQGYLTIPGGHRVGLAGRAVVEGGRIKVLRDISSFNFRVARQVKGAGEKVLAFIFDRRSGRILHSLVISPPQGGKTTLLRDLARLISEGAGILGQAGKKVGIVDERSEIAGCYQGVPQLDVGFRTDVLDACPKAEGIMLMLRSLSPQVIITDEIGRGDDVKAIEEAIHAGVSVIASAHGSSLEEICQRPIMGGLLQKNYFERLIFLSNRRGPGTLEMIIEGEKGLPLYSLRHGGE